MCRRHSRFPFLLMIVTRFVSTVHRTVSARSPVMTASIPLRIQLWGTVFEIYRGYYTTSRFFCQVFFGQIRRGLCAPLRGCHGCHGCRGCHGCSAGHFAVDGEIGFVTTPAANLGLSRVFGWDSVRCRLRRPRRVPRWAFQQVLPRRERPWQLLPQRGLRWLPREPRRWRQAPVSYSY